ncbi:aminoglycoside phosphotransferase family protein [Luteimonas sp. FCS-9]|uniref:aminoglycoside phosphotransferase family protein n=1 Tax=Luteimonas sp. FCS-9 TaxID=1547516 RepID=UPI0009E2C956|nr:aminoglycoside phosphotransferase family protein [Luteimonas sp. FCS-9]
MNSVGCDIEANLALYEIDRYGTTRIRDRRALSSAANLKESTARRLVLETAFCSDRNITELESLNSFESVFGIESERERFVAKICNPLQNEIGMSRLVQASGEPVSPPLLEVHEPGIAIFPRCEPYLNELNVFEDWGLLQVQLREAADLLSKIHSMDSPIGLEPSRPKVEIGRFQKISLEEYEQLPGFEVHAYVEAAQRLQRQLLYVKKVNPSCFVHGDFKFDNVVYWKRRLVAIDWESAGLGHREADLGIYIGCIVSIWLKEKSRSYSGDVSQILSEGGTGLRQCVLALASFLNYYCECGSASINVRLLMVYIGNFLLDRGLITNMLGGRFNLETMMCFKLGQLIVSKPIAIFRACKGMIGEEVGSKDLI